MMEPVNTDYGGKLIEEISRVLKQRAESAQLMGIPRWNIILDPGTNIFFQQWSASMKEPHISSVASQALALPRRLTKASKFCEG